MPASRHGVLVACFALFLYPISAGVLSINYSFLAFPVFVFLTNPARMATPPRKYLLVIALYLLILAGASIYQVGLAEEAGRRLVSFLIFMTMFAYMFVKIDSPVVESFKSAVVLFSSCVSLRSVYEYFALGGASLGFEAKDIVGTQRIGFIYLLAIGIVYLDERYRANRLIKYSILMVLLAGLFLTFSRSSIVALLGMVVLLGIERLVRWLRRPRFRAMVTGAAAVAGIALCFVLLKRVVPVTFDFFEARLVEFVSDPEAVKEHLLNSETSEGTRVLIGSKIVEFVARNPLTGSGYLGVWILPEALAGSAHNQYADVLFRTGIFGFCAYAYLLVALLRFLYRTDAGLFWGVVGMLLYGMFHETFKESQGGFILAFLLGMLSQKSTRERLWARRVAPLDLAARSRVTLHA